jgi:hypothetical protein
VLLLLPLPLLLRQPEGVREVLLEQLLDVPAGM